MKKLLAFMLALSMLLFLFACSSESNGSSDDSSNTTVKDNNSTNEDILASTGLEYTLSNDGSYYIVSGIGSCTDTNVIIPSQYNGLPVEVIGEAAFKSNKTIETLFLSKTVKLIKKGAFYNSSIKKVEFAQNSQLKIIEGEWNEGGVFAECDNLESISLPNGLIEIGAYLFEGCDILESISLPNSVEIIEESAFRSCPKLTQINIPNSVYYIGQQCFEDSYNIGYEVYMDNSIYIDNVLMGLVSYTEESLNNISWKPETIGIYDSFAECKNLEQIDIPEGVQFIGSDAFRYCNNLTTIKLPSTIKTIGPRAFYECGFSEITIPEGTIFIDFNAFRECDNLMEIKIPNSTVSIGENAFSGCNQLNKISLGSSLCEIGEYAFCGTNISYIQIPRNVHTIGQGAFSGCSKLERVFFENNSKLKTIGRDSWRGDSGTFEGTMLVDIILPEGVEYIGDYTFEECESLISITIPSTIKHLGAALFYNSDFLKEIHYNSTIENWNSITKVTGTWQWDASTNEYIIYCSDGNIEK